MGIFNFFKGKNENSNDSVSRVNLDKMEDVGIVTHFKGRPFTGVGFRLHENGELKLECTFKDGLKHGKYEQFYENGKVKLETYFEEDKQDGLTKEYHENGVLYIESNWKEGKLDELIKEYNENGELKTATYFKDGDVEPPSSKSNKLEKEIYDFYQLTEQNITIYKDGKEIGSGFLCFSIFENNWEEEFGDYDREEVDSFIVLNGKELDDDDYDYDDTEWGEEREISNSTDLNEITKQFEEIRKE